MADHCDDHAEDEFVLVTRRKRRPGRKKKPNCDSLIQTSHRGTKTTGTVSDRVSHFTKSAAKPPEHSPCSEHAWDDWKRNMLQCMDFLQVSPWFKSLQSTWQDFLSQSELKQVLCLGLGNFMSLREPQAQLCCFFMLIDRRAMEKLRSLRRGNIEKVASGEHSKHTMGIAFDPAFSSFECAVLEALGINVVSAEQAERRCVDLYFAPHCPPPVYASILAREQHSELGKRHNFAYLGNYLERYREASLATPSTSWPPGLDNLLQYSEAIEIRGKAMCEDSVSEYSTLYAVDMQYPSPSRHGSIGGAPSIHDKWATTLHKAFNNTYFHVVALRDNR